MFSSFQLDPILPVQDPRGGSRGSSCHPLLAEPTVIPDRNGPRRGRSALIAPVPGSPHFSTGRESPLVLDSSIRLIAWILRRRFTESGVSENASSLILSATQKNTNAAYQAVWNSWGNWCSAREKDPLSPCNADIVNFLTEYG